MTKTKSCVATRDAVCQATNLFPDEVGTKKCLLPYLFGYLFSVAYDNRYLVRGSKENVLSIGNIPGNHIVSGFWLMALLHVRTKLNNYCPQRSWGKVIFSEVCVKNSVHIREQCMLGDTGSKRPVRNLLECILV